MAIPLALFGHFGSASVRALRYAEAHTGVPVIVLAGIALVVGFRLFRKSLRFAFEVAVVVGLLCAASFFGWVRF